jgi:hypothetical protein
MTRFLLMSDICGFVDVGRPPLTRGRVCRLQFLLVMASAVILRLESRGTHDHILLSQIRDSPNLEGQVPVFISPRNRVGQLYPQALGSLFAASTTHRVEVFEPASTRPPIGCPYIASALTQKKSPLPTIPLFLHAYALPKRRVYSLLLLYQANRLFSYKIWSYQRVENDCSM